MKLTIIADDNLVIVNGVGFKVDMTGIDPMIHAVQWYDTYGDIEWKPHDDFGNRKENFYLIDVSPYQVFIDRWNVAKVAHDAVVAAEAAAAAAKQAAIAAAKQTAIANGSKPVNVIAN